MLKVGTGRYVVGTWRFRGHNGLNFGFADFLSRVWSGPRTGKYVFRRFRYIHGGGVVGEVTGERGVRCPAAESSEKVPTTDQTGHRG